MNVDASANGGMSKNVGMCNNDLAKLWGVRDGLQLAQQLGITKLDRGGIGFKFCCEGAGTTVGSHMQQTQKKAGLLHWQPYNALGQAIEPEEAGTRN
ncbi:hypothetical protein FRX31_010028 [Thalictrum thalictroides]|uniref:Uncharacterized protein n=1 Tax=Thalictrum thalictroides TaxID=46969 RepID=A0A7J6WSN4_THATH|nr:hypothetical protein FRX31_010028 [Thalictrum thalictroides]